MDSSLEERIDAALAIAEASCKIVGLANKAWFLDQIVRALTGCPQLSNEPEKISVAYVLFVTNAEIDQNGEKTHVWDIGTTS